MKIKINNNELRNAVDVIGKFIPARSPIPAAECVYIEAQKDGYVWVRNFDPWSASASLMIRGDVKQEGTEYIPAKKLGAILGRLDVDVIELESDGKICSIQNGDSEYSLGVIDDEFTKPEHIDGSPIVMDAEVFKDLIEGVSFACATDGKIHSGVQFTVYAGLLRLVALDGYRLAVREIQTEAEDCDFVISAKVLNSLKSIVSGEVKIFHGKRAARIQNGELNLTVPFLQGEFLDFRKAMPKDTKTTVSGFRDAFLKKIECVNSINDQKKPIIAKITPNGCELTVQTGTAYAKEIVPCYKEGEDLTIGFNPIYIFDAIKHCGDEIEMKLCGAFAPATFAGNGYFYLVLPVKIK